MQAIPVSDEDEDDYPADAEKTRIKRSRMYMCKDCGHQAKRWGRLKLHMRNNCDQCVLNPASVSERTREDCTVHLYDYDDVSNDKKQKLLSRRKSRSYGGTVVPEMYIVKKKKKKKRRNQNNYTPSSQSY